MAKKKTTRKTEKKTTASSNPKKSAKKSPAKKTVKKKKVVEKKSSSKKKVVQKETTEIITKKTTKTVTKTVAKPTSKKITKKSVKKKAPTKKTPAKKSAAKSTAKKSNSKTKKGPVKSAKSSAVKIPRGRSVAEIASMTQADSDGYVVISGRRVRMMTAKPLPESDSGEKGTKKKTRKSTSKSDLSPNVVISEQKPDGSGATKKTKTNLTTRELSHYRKLLLQKRRDLMGDLTSHENQALRANDGDSSSMPIHMADIGSDTYEQEFMLGMAEKERGRLKEIDSALALIAEKTYGVCQKTGEMIPQARLEAKPWARFTVEAARQNEVGE